MENKKHFENENIRRWWVSFYKDPGDPGWEEPYDTLDDVQQAVTEFMAAYPNGECGLSPECYEEDETW